MNIPGKVGGYSREEHQQASSAQLGLMQFPLTAAGPHAARSIDDRLSRWDTAGI